jgi:hypothetical protein
MHEFNTDTIVLLIPFAAIAAGTVIGCAAILARIRRRDMMHRERMAAIDKGISLPSLPETVTEQKLTEFIAAPERYLRRALVLLFLGAAWMLIFRENNGGNWEGNDHWQFGRWGMLAVAVGLADLLFYFIARKKTGQP